MFHHFPDRSVLNFLIYSWVAFVVGNLTRPSNPGLKSSAAHRKTEGFPGSWGLESGPMF